MLSPQDTKLLNIILNMDKISYNNDEIVDFKVLEGLPYRYAELAYLDTLSVMPHEEVVQIVKCLV